MQTTKYLHVLATFAHRNVTFDRISCEWSMVVPVKWVFPIIRIGKALLAVDLWVNALVP